MKGYRFYLEFNSPADKRAGRDNGNVAAVIVEDGIFWSGDVACYEAIGNVFSHANSMVCGTSVSVDYLATYTKRISEQEAREIHPNLFAYLDSEED